MTIKLLKENYVQTSDLALATCLCYFGYSIDEIDKSNPRKAQFVIKRDEKIDDYIKKFWRHELTVEPVAFINLIKEIKNRLYDN